MYDDLLTPHIANLSTWVKDRPIAAHLSREEKEHATCWPRSETTPTL